MTPLRGNEGAVMAKAEPRPGRNDPCWCGSGKKYKSCHSAQDDKVESFRLKGHMVPRHSQLKTPEQIQGMRDSSVLNMAILDAVGESIHAGMSTQEIDDIVVRLTAEMGGIAAPLNYEGFPKSVCTSVNSQVCHGIPSEKDILRDGDIINVDVSTLYKGYYSDSSRMYIIGGKTDPDRANVVEAAKACRDAGVAAVKPWITLGDVAYEIQKVAKQYGCTIVREIGGHGVGIEFHEEPFVSYVSRPGTELLLVPGFTFTVEPMINAGKHEIYVDQDNDWTVYTEDGRPSAQWESTVLVTEDGCEVLTC